MKRDPSAYYEEFKQQHRHFEVCLCVFLLGASPVLPLTCWGVIG